MIDNNLKQQLQNIVGHEINTAEQMIYFIERAKQLGPSPKQKKTRLFRSEVYFQNGQEIVVTIDYKLGDQQHYSPLHTHDFFEMFYVYHGNYFSSINGENHKFHEGDLCIYNLQSKHRVMIPNKNDIIFNILIHPSLMQQTFFTMLSDQSNLTAFFVDSLQNPDMESSYLIFNCNQNQSIQFYLHNIIVEYFNGKDTQQSRKYLRILLLGLLTMLSTEYQRSFEAENTDEIKTDILKYIQQNYQAITLSQMAEHFHYSKRNMIYYIYKHTGKTFSELQQEIRLNRIKELLSNSSLSITNICSQVGYSSYFASKLFKRKIGTTMSQYRKKNKK